MNAFSPLAAAALCACLALLVLCAARPDQQLWNRAVRLLGGQDASTGPREPRTPAAVLRRLRDVARGVGAGRRPALCTVPAGVLVGLLTWSPVPVLAGAAAAPLIGRALRRRADRAADARAAAAVEALCGTLAADLRAGRPPHAALAEAVDAAGWRGSAELTEAAHLLSSAARFGGDVPQALRAAAGQRSGLRGLAAVAACWQVAVDGGAGLAAALDRVAAALRAESDQREDLRAQLAGPRSTAVLLALLPLFGLVLGSALGADPSRVLLHTPTGLACLTGGVVLEAAGLGWTARIIRRAQGAPS
jgi:tight adherence protein B